MQQPLIHLQASFGDVQACPCDWPLVRAALLSLLPRRLMELGCPSICEGLHAGGSRLVETLDFCSLYTHHVEPNELKVAATMRQID